MYKILLTGVLIFWVLSYKTIAQSNITSNLPIIVLDTKGAVIENDNKIQATFQISAPDPDQLHRFDINSNNNNFQFSSDIGIEIRGNTSVFWEKKSYSIELRDANGNGIDAPLLGMPAESDWVLNACYGDKSFIRDVFAHEFYNRTGRYSPKTRFVEVYMKQTGSMSYRGVYILMEKIKRSSNRISIKKLTETDTDPKKITGGYLLQIGEDEDLKWTSSIPPNDAPLQPKPIFHVEYPKLHNYSDMNVRNLQYNYIKDWINHFEQVLNSPNYKDPVTGYRSLLDTDAMIDYLLLQELTKNSDNWRASTFLYKNRDDEGGKLVMGAPWDFDKSMGNQQWCFELSVLPTGSWAWQFNVFCQDRPPMTVFWPKALLSDCYFKNKLVQRYTQLRNSEWSNENMLDFIEEKKTQLTVNNAIQRNFSKWNILEQEVMFNQHYSLNGNTYYNEVDYLKSWLTDHLNWMDNNINSISSQDCPLPVTFIGYDLTKRDNGILVFWSTSSEVNNDHFEIQRSSNGKEFKTIGTIKGKGTIKDKTEYDFLDQSPLSGVSYYRIRQVDLDGTADYTSIKSISNISDKRRTIIFPNPTSEFIKLDNYSIGSRAILHNSLGEVVMEKVLSNQSEIISTGILKAGSYVLTIYGNDGTLTSSQHLVIEK